MPVSALLTPPDGRIKTVLTTIGTLLATIVESGAVKYVFVPPDSDTGVAKGVYLELLPSKYDVESLGSTQRSFNPLAIDIIGLIRHEDPLVGVNFLEQQINTLESAAAIAAYKDAFATNNGFSIEFIADSDVTPATYKAGTAAYSQTRLRLHITMGMDL